MRSTTKNTLGTLSLLLLTSTLVASTGSDRPDGTSGDPTDLGDGQIIDQTYEGRPTIGTGGNANDFGHGATPTGGGVTAPELDSLQAANGQYDLGDGSSSTAAQAAPGSGIGAGSNGDASDFGDGSGGDVGPDQKNRDSLDQAGNPNDFGDGTAPVFDDCNENGTPDYLEIAADPALDLNGNGRLDRCDARAADVDGNGQINVLDLIQVILRWGECEGCGEDLTADNMVDVNDLAELLDHWL